MSQNLYYRNPFAFVYGVFMLLIVAMLSVVLTIDHFDKKHCHQELMKEVQPVIVRAPALFEKLDSDGDGLLHQEELRNASLAGGFTGEDKAVVDFLYKHCKEVGHEVGQYKTGKYTYSVYGISRVDLQILPETARKRWGN